MPGCQENFANGAADYFPCDFTLQLRFTLSTSSKDQQQTGWKYAADLPTKTYTVAIPEGVVPGQKVRLFDEGVFLTLAIPEDKKSGDVWTFTAPASEEVPEMPSDEKYEAEFKADIPKGLATGETFTVQVGDKIVTLTVPEGENAGDSLVFGVLADGDSEKSELVRHTYITEIPLGVSPGDAFEIQVAQKTTTLVVPEWKTAGEIMKFDDSNLENPLTVLIVHLVIVFLVLRALQKCYAGFCFHLTAIVHGNKFCSPPNLGSSLLLLKCSSLNSKLNGGGHEKEWFAAASSGDNHTIIRLLQIDRGLVDQKDSTDRNRTALHKATSDSMKRLLQKFKWYEERIRSFEQESQRAQAKIIMLEKRIEQLQGEEVKATSVSEALSVLLEQHNINNLDDDQLSELEIVLFDSCTKVRKLKQELKANEELCCICLSRKKAVVFVPCSHMCTCQ